ncbi:hypothetical protein Patl1_23427 [Pistacia atlantica]|uniref:Uncharacterized protein n=1 Tax=Pistacia atlantica TaxID=434234 RepID=A0ACC0ZYL8_9ROSI|nr:hypothetical protein Patl1_23427 [Pistacia atlantica]
MSSHVLESAQKPQLRKAFKLLKTHACKVANFTLQWQDLEDHLRFINSLIESKIQLQQNTIKNTQNDNNPESKPLVSTQNNKNPDAEISNEDKTETQTSSLPVKNGKELILYMREHRKDVGNRLYCLFKAVDDPGKLVLEALQESYPPGFSKGEAVDSEIRRNCVVLLEEFGRVRDRVEPHVREEAKRLAVEWKGRVENSLEALGFLQLLIGFDLVGEFDSDEILKHFDNVVMRREAPELLRALGFAHKASEIIQKLIKKYQQLEAIRFIYEFDLVKQFPPVPLLKAHAKYAKEVANKIRKQGNNSPKAQDDATKSEIASLRGMIRFIKNYQLSSQYSPKILRNHIQRLERQRKESKEDAKATVSNAQSQQQKGNKRTSPASKAQQNRNKWPRTVAADASANTSQAIHSKQPSHHQPASLFAGQGAQHSTPSADIDAPSKDVAYAYGGAASNVQSIQPYPNQLSDPLTRARCLAPSLEKYHIAGLDGQASAGIDALSKADSYAHVGADSYSHSVQPPLGQSTGLLPGAQDLILSLTNYLSAVSMPVTSYTTTAPGPYGLVGSAAVHPHMSSSLGTYDRTVPANGNSGHFGLDRSHAPLNFASNANTNVSAPYYHGDLQSSYMYYNRPASSSSAGMAPNTSSNAFGYYDRRVSTSGNFGLSSEYPPSVYHP